MLAIVSGRMTSLLRLNRSFPVILQSGAGYWQARLVAPWGQYGPKAQRTTGLRAIFVAGEGAKFGSWLEGHVARLIAGSDDGHTLIAHCPDSRSL